MPPRCAPRRAPGRPRQRAPRDPGGVQAPQQYQDALGLVHDGHRFMEVLDIGERFKCRVEFAANKVTFGNYCTCYEGGARQHPHALHPAPPRRR